ncbi:hypothetical protein NIES4101_32400 [Calothrix sp. NIES-4101]|nr:hypothetical protein NIES4101_27320 [Calothrix sp. NIES-4101]BAZ37319.1 hypothetical protein NIES4101_32400 [Calothrix sp. NIES-4101]
MRIVLTQKALSNRFLTFPAIFFEKVFKELLPQLQQQWNYRQKRPLPDGVNFALSRFKKIWIVDGSTLEALFRKLKSLEDVPPGTLAGKIVTIIDLVTHLPVEIWLTKSASRSDIKFEPDILNLVSENTLLLLDRGFYHFHFWQQLIEQQVDFITRIKKGAFFQVKEVFSNSYALRDRLIVLGCGKKSIPILTLRLVEIRSEKQWHSYLTSVLDTISRKI